MTEHKFTDEEIILAHRCCTDIGMGCLDCPFGNNENAEGCASLNKLVLDLINRQKEEIEVIKETTAEIRYEAVKEFAERLKTYYRNLDKTAGALIEYHIDQIAKEMLEGNVCGVNTETEK